MNFYNKHRPKTLSDLIYADAQVEHVIKETAELQRNQHIILHGPCGSGKSETARLILEGRIGIENVNHFSAPIQPRNYHFHDFEPILKTWDWQIAMGASQGCIIIDEIDQFSSVMQKRLRALMDGYTSGIVLATTNNLHLVDGPLKDRCRCLHLLYPPAEKWVERATAILTSEKIQLSREQVSLLLEGFEGSGRTMMQWLEDATICLPSTRNKM